jgi:hypothetical protein
LVVPELVRLFVVEESGGFEVCEMRMLVGVRRRLEEGRRGLVRLLLGWRGRRMMVVEIGRGS